ncbi:Inactive protein kinase [Morus notabilis]|uniref:non-specific serine/threonine protein kinase n=1 Tax=Morus notabilis TaxID=981085 RepID=W9S163_9ROSA|nr:inactive protein kinase SELMODRAFT_444075 [Morus notabilis]EXC07348.1 Inactive protein kinase [Morus notabilis]
MFRDAVDRSVKRRAANAMAHRVVVAVKAEKLISKSALAWALNHVVHPGDCITLLAVLSGERTGKRFWRFPILAGDCGSNRREKLPDRICQISESCSQMVLQFHNQIEVTVRIKVVLGSPAGVVAAEAKGNGANWVILDKKLKQELKHCIEELRCNIVVMKGSQPKVLRLNLASSDGLETPFFSAASSPMMDFGKIQGFKMKHSTPVSSPDEASTSYRRISKEDSLSSFNSAASAFLVYEQNPLFEGPQKGTYDRLIDEQNDFEESLSPIDSNQERLITLSRIPRTTTASNQSVFWIPENHIVDGKHPKPQNHRNPHKIRSFNKLMFDKDLCKGRVGFNQTYNKDYINSSIRDAISVGRTSSVPPPLCSLCQHKTPMFGKPPKQFSYKELDEATDGFSDINFLAESGFGVVHRGVLRDGQVVAVKQLKFGGSQADADFSREVRVLSCAQHRNVVLLIGYCIEGNVRMLVYEYICNSSLDFHLHGNESLLEWHARLKIATGTARGLRYLHEDCRVGCIVHRDLRPNNILLTHDFEPMVADFGLARWHSEWDISTEVQVFGSAGYLAPEYVDGGQITHKIDVYAFGLVLLELMTGQRIAKLKHTTEHHFLVDWFFPLAALESNNIMPNYYQILDPTLASEQSPDFLRQLEAMGRAASLCLLRDPESRPQMSKILRVLEGGDLLVPLGSDMNTVGSRSGHLQGLSSRVQPELRISHSRKLSH